jgi:hypothetical protein
MRTFGNDREQALLFWRDLVDNKGKSCILLEEPESKRFSVWGKFVFDKNLVKPAVKPVVPVGSTQINSVQTDQQIGSQTSSAQIYSIQIDISLVKACLLILQTIYLEIEDLFGARQVSLFKQDVLKILLMGHFPQVDGMEKLERFLFAKDLANLRLPNWDDRQLQTLLQELYKISKSYFGNNLFLNATRNAIEDLPPDELAKFQTWLSKSPSGKFWQ